MSSSALDPLLLPADVVVSPVADLSPDVLAVLDHEPGDFCVTRPKTRTVSSVVDARTAALLEHFREPRTIVEAVVAFAATVGADASRTLDAAFPALAALAEEGMLVPAASSAADAVAASLAPGTLVGDVEVVEPVHVLDDTEVYRARAADGTAAAVKVAGRAAGPEAIAAIRQEAAVLDRVGGEPAPVLLAAGHVDGRPFLVRTWHDGADLYQASTDARALAGADARDELLELCERVLDAYARLHMRGVHHGDVHPRNALVGPRGEVTLIDFGLAVLPGDGGEQLRGGIDLFQAPEIARARLDARPLDPLSPAAEQYGVAALLYYVLTGGHTHGFSLQADEMLRQVATEPVLAFSAHGAAGLEATEACIGRALAKEAEDRHASVDEFLAAFRRAAAADRAAPASSEPTPERGRELVASVRERLRAGGERFDRGLDPPTASPTYGAAGVAYALLRLARARGDEGLLAEADAWAVRAVHETPNHDATWNEALGIVPGVFGHASLYHHAAGVHAVAALIAAARGDDGAQLRAIDAFAAAAEGSEHVDVAFGRSGLLLGCALLLDALPGHLEGSALRAPGDRLAGAIAGTLGDEPPIAQGPQLTALGAAHGWSGCLFALLRWAEANAAPAPDAIRRRVDELADLAEPAGRGLRWPAIAGEAVEDSVLTPSWCNGAAGHAHLFTLAHRTWGDPRFDAIARRACWTAYSVEPLALGDLCCGLTGRAYALLARYRHTGEREWLARARSLAARAAAQPAMPEQRRDSLFHGEPGIAILLADLEEPDAACMPLFEAEG